MFIYHLSQFSSESFGFMSPPSMIIVHQTFIFTSEPTVFLHLRDRSTSGMRVRKQFKLDSLAATTASAREQETINLNTSNTKRNCEIHRSKMSAYYTFLTNRGPSRLIESLASRYKSARDRAGNSLIKPKPSKMPGSELWTPAPPPKTGLGRYRVLSSRAGIRVSPIQLGAMSIGDKWHRFGMGTMDKENSFKLLDAYYKAGGNFIDTANT